jgi:hypothetical protein
VKIYRFIPNGRDYPSIAHTVGEQWWPEGVDMGSLGAFLPRATFGSVPPFEGPCFLGHDPEAPLSDFPSLSLQLPILSPRAARVLAEAKLIEPPVPMTVSGIPCFAVQPLLTQVKPELPRAFVADSSRSLTMPNGEVLLYYSRSFDLDKVPGEFFTIPELEPFSDLYVTDRLLEVAHAERLTGLEFVELVFDDGPIEARYPTPRRTGRPCIHTPRAELEWELLEARCDPMLYPRLQIEEAVFTAVREGYVTFDFIEPEYRRSLPPPPLRA